MVAWKQRINEIELSFEGELITIRNATSSEYGGMLSRESPSTQALKDLRQQHRISFQGFLLQKGGFTAGKREYKLFIVLYGMQDRCKPVAKLLDSAGLFLQTPPIQDLWAPYINPHSLCNPTTHTLLEQDGDDGITINNRSPEKPKISRRLDDQCPLKQELQDLVDCAQGPTTYSATSASLRLKTNLRPYVYYSLL